MFNRVLFLILTLGFSASAAATPALEAGATSFTFQINEDFRLGQFDGAAVAVKKHFSPRSALRVQIGGNVSSSDVTLSFSGSGSEPGSETDELSFRLDSQYIRYASVRNSVGAFFGAGPFFEISTYDREDPNDDDVLNSSRDTWRFGARFLFGAEYFPTSNLGIHAEYGLSVASSQLEDKQDLADGRTRVAEIDQVSFGGDQFLFGLSVYF